MDSHDPRDMLFCEKLLGLRVDCNMCHQPAWEISTGWLLYDVSIEQWFIGFVCPTHGFAGRGGGQWQPLIDEVIKMKAQEGVDIAAALQALRDERKSKRGMQSED